MINVIASNALTILNPTDEIYKWCVENLIIDNPDYYKKQRMGKWIGNTPEKLYLYSVKGNEIHIPFGCLQKLHSRFGAEISWKPLFRQIKPVSYQSNINLYPYQENAVKSILKQKNGVLVMPCGSGKTNCGLVAISRIGGKALWLTHTQDLLNQSMDRAKSILDIKGSYGKITAGKIDIGTHITFATVQTMCKIDLSQYKDYWDIIIVDECAHAAGSPTRVTQFYKVLSNLSARYKIGLTATPKRADGLEKSMFALLGDIIHEVPKSEVEQFTCPVVVHTVETGYEPDYNAVLMGDGTLNYTELINDLTNNQERFKTVLNYINNLGKSVLVLANRVEYLQNLNAEFNGKSVCLSGMGQSKKAKAERKETLRKLNNGELDAVFASYQLAAEGLDVPNLQYVVFATPVKDEITVIQSAGRVGRKAEGKKIGTVIDFVDDFSLYRRYFAKRKSYYKKIEAEVK